MWPIISSRLSWSLPIGQHFKQNRSTKTFLPSFGTGIDPLLTPDLSTHFILSRAESTNGTIGATTYRPLMEKQPTYKNIHNRFKLNGNHYRFEDLFEVAYSFIKEGEEHERAIGDFLMDWIRPNPTITLRTSGSTGTPKLITYKKQAMVNSALATGNHFGVKIGDRALHCLNADFIAGKMMLVRAMILGLELDLLPPREML